MRRRTAPIRILAALGAAAFVAAACTPAAEVPAPTTTLGTTTTTTTTMPPTTTTTTEPEYGNPRGGTVVVAEAQEPATLNPYVRRGEDLIVSTIGQSYFAGVYNIDGETLELIPEIVTELPTTSNGGVVVNENGTMTVKYTILEEAVWEDGTPISGNDFAFTVDLLQTPEADAGFRIDEVYEGITSYEAGPKTFELVLAEPTVLYQQLFRVVLPQHAVEGTDFVEDWNDRMWPSGGPFRFSSWTTGDRIVVERNENYWKQDAETGQQLPYLDSIEFRFIPSEEDIINAFKRREVQVIQPPPDTAVDELVALDLVGARLDAVPGRIWEHLNFQFGPGTTEVNAESANSSYAYRRSVAHLVDREAVAAVASPYAEPLTSYVDAFSPTLSQHAWDRYTHDPARAEQMLSAVNRLEEDASIVAVFSTTNVGDARVLVSEALRPMFEEVGVEYRTQLQDPQVFFGETFDNGAWDVGMWSWTGSSGFDGLVTIHDAFDPEGSLPEGSNYYRWGTEDSTVRNRYTERFAEVRDLMNSTVDDGELVDLIAEAEEILASRMIMLPLFSYPVFGVVWDDEIAGFVQTPTQADYTWNVEQWYRADL